MSRVQLLEAFIQFCDEADIFSLDRAIGKAQLLFLI